MNTPQFPPLFHRLFAWFCHPDFYEELQGDLEENFYKDCESHGIRYAQKRYKIEVLKLFRPSVIKQISLPEFTIISRSMIQNYLKVALRNLKKHSDSSIINILGLTLGIAGALLIGLFVHDEWQFDRAHPDNDQLYRVYTESYGAGQEMLMASSSPRLGQDLVTEFPGVVQSLRIYQVRQKLLFKYEDKSYLEENGFFAEPQMLEFFHLPFLYGDPKTALTEPNTLVISASMAKKYFGEENPVGKSFTINGRARGITGVLKDVSPHFHLDFQYLISFSTLLKRVAPDRMQNWVWQDFFTYVKLHPSADPKDLEHKFRAFAEREIHPQTKELNFYYYPLLQKAEDIHLHSVGFRSDVARRGNHIYIKGLVAIGIFLLLIACINFVNLTTARAIQRAKEVGIRKTTGATKGQVAVQFLGEALLITTISAGLAISLTVILLPIMNSFAEKNISMQAIPVLQGIIGTLVGIGLIGALAGGYPALMISGFKPIEALRAVFATPSSKGRWLRKALVIVQFSLSILLIISVFVVSRQINLLAKKDLGFQQEQLLHFPMKGKLFQNYESAKTEFASIPGVVGASTCFGVPGDIVAGDNIIVPGEERQNHLARMFMVDPEFLPTMGIELVAGRNFAIGSKKDAAEAFIVNETAVKALGLGDSPEDALGKQLEWPTWNGPDSLKKGRIIGVVKDFHYASLHEEVQTSVLHIEPQSYWKIALKLETKDMGAVLAAVEAKWDDFETGFPIDYQFVDAGFGAMYAVENKWNTLIRIGAFLAILIAGIGAFGLAAYASEQRRKEITIRKILGASVAGIVGLLSRDFVSLILVSLLIASPIAWYAMDNWLNNFAYRAEIHWWIFPLAGMAALLVGAFTVGSQGLKAALGNPAVSLRND